MRLRGLGFLLIGVVLAACNNGGTQSTARAPIAAPTPLQATSLDNPENVEESLTTLGFQLPNRRQAASDFQLEDLNGETVTLSELQGQVVFLNFWATWCGPCRLEMPDMEGLHQALGDEGLHLLAVNIREEPEPVRRFMTSLGLSFDVVMDVSGEVAKTYAASSLPMTYLIDRDGTILARAIGAREWKGPEIVQMFQALLAREPAGAAG